jgi:prepilin-type N-terminal cleavage/methylation domain-containing protein
MEAVVSTRSSVNYRRSRQTGFSMVELLMTAFILAIGLLGLSMLQIMSIRSSTGSQALNTAVRVGEGVLESIQQEGRQRMLVLKYGGAEPASTYFVAGPITEYYAFDGTKLASSAGAFYTVVIAPKNVVALSAAGGTTQFTLTITFTDTVGAVIATRQVTLTRQVAYA